MEQIINDPSSKEYFTKDLGEAAALVAKEVKLSRLEKDSSFYWFVFDRKSCEEITAKYWSGELQLDAKKYNDSLRSLKDRLFASK